MTAIRRQLLDVLKFGFYAAPLLLTACANQQEAVEEVSQTVPPEPAAQQSRGQAANTQADQVDPLLSQLVIHFDYDDSTVGPDYQPLLLAHGKYLAEHNDLSLRLEGHADERGSREYNVGLGSRRASAVRQLLLLQGARDEQIETLSYGEEKPAVAGRNERAWSENRRVEFNYLSDL
jgi:peptidoglycan-associated lipoprotein